MKKMNILFLVLAVIIAAVTTAFSGFLPGKAGSESSISDPIEQGWKWFRLGEYGSAAKAFQRALRSARPGSEEMVKAVYGLALASWLRTPDSDRPKAKALFERLVNDVPTHDLAVWSELALVRMEHILPVGESPDYPALSAAYGKVYAAHPSHPAGLEAFICAQEVRMISFKPEDARAAVVALQNFIDKKPDPRFVGWAWRMLSLAHKILDDSEGQLNSKIMALKTMESDPNNPRSENTNLYWEIATLAHYEVGDLAIAREYYSRLRKEIPRDMRNFAVRRALEKIDKLEKVRIKSSMLGNRG